MRLIDLSGCVFGDLKVIKRAESPKNAKQVGVYWLCKCSCGNEKVVFGSDLKKNTTKSCGCKWHINRKRGVSENEIKISGDIVEIYFNKAGVKAIIDIEDYAKIKKYHWNVSSYGYAYTSIYENGKKRHLFMHRYILNLYNKSQLADHINGDRLDNRKKNLRVVTHMQNCQNHKFLDKNQCGFNGVKKEKSGWSANIGYNNKVMFLGCYKTLEDAIQARKTAEEKYFGEYRRTNGNWKQIRCI